MPDNTPNRGYEYPLYSDTQNFPAQIQAFAEDVDADVTALEALLAGARQRPSARIEATAAQAITTSTNTLLTFSNLVYADGVGVNLGVFPTGLSLTEQGIYLISGRVTFDASSSGSAFSISAALLSSSVLIPTSARASSQGHPNEPTWVHVNSLHYADGTAPDDITFEVRQESGGNRNASIRTLAVTKISNLTSGT